MEIQAYEQDLDKKVGFIDPGLVNQKFVIKNPDFTEDYLLKCLLHHQYKKFILLPYSYEYVFARHGILNLWATRF
jgi:hypothetical protein